MGDYISHNVVVNFLTESEVRGCLKFRVSNNDYVFVRTSEIRNEDSVIIIAINSKGKLESVEISLSNYVSLNVFDAPEGLAKISDEINEAKEKVERYESLLDDAEDDLYQSQNKLKNLLLEVKKK